MIHNYYRFATCVAVCLLTVCTILSPVTAEAGSADIIGATNGEDYTLEYMTAGDLAGYTVLTVGSEPFAGDIDGDGWVGSGDLNLILTDWGKGTLPTP